jgi:two-component system CheB/CheR fusion protein
LRTPLSPVPMGISIMQEEKNLDRSTTDILEMMRRNIEMEIRLIDDLLDWTKIKREKIELIRQPIDLCLLLDQVSLICREEILAHNFDFTLDYGENRPFMVNGDPVRLQQVFGNLHKISIKFTPAHGRIGIRCLKQVDRYVIIEFSDSGIGIDTKVLPRVFDAFEQGERKTTRLFGGLGLGLAISKSLVELHDGTIEARSGGLGHEASFLVNLPLLVTSDSLDDAPTAPLGTAPNYGLKILVVEDHLDTSKLLEHVLQKNGYKATIAKSIEEALSSTANQHFDLMISDIGLPDGSGCELLLELRRRGNHFPAMALSGYGQQEDIRRNLGVGFSAHITKPVMPSKLIETLGLVIRGRNP